MTRWDSTGNEVGNRKLPDTLIPDANSISGAVEFSKTVIAYDATLGDRKELCIPEAYCNTFPLAPPSDTTDTVFATEDGSASNVVTANSLFYSYCLDLTD